MHINGYIVDCSDCGQVYKAAERVEWPEQHLCPYCRVKINRGDLVELNNCKQLFTVVALDGPIATLSNGDNIHVNQLTKV